MKLWCTSPRREELSACWSPVFDAESAGVIESADREENFEVCEKTVTG
jgi:hypothetical protein